VDPVEREFAHQLEAAQAKIAKELHAKGVVSESTEVQGAGLLLRKYGASISELAFALERSDIAPPRVLTALASYRADFEAKDARVGENS
jgi:hypothetical protein